MFARLSEALLPHMRPAKEKHGVHESSVRVAYCFRKEWPFQPRRHVFSVCTHCLYISLKKARSRWNNSHIIYAMSFRRPGRSGGEAGRRATKAALRHQGTESWNTCRCIGGYWILVDWCGLMWAATVSNAHAIGVTIQSRVKVEAILCVWVHTIGRSSSGGRSDCGCAYEICNDLLSGFRGFCGSNPCISVGFLDSWMTILYIYNLLRLFQHI